MSETGEVLIAALKGKDVRLEHRTSNRKMFWADDAQQWEVYSFDRFPTWHYKGKSITDALAALADFTPRVGQME